MCKYRKHAKTETSVKTNRKGAKRCVKTRANTFKQKRYNTENTIKHMCKHRNRVQTCVKSAVNRCKYFNNACLSATVG